ncbi:MAG: hypothetical protein IJT41_07015 [Clostridia bacterium]|nr:hypothetical protein [Clostridia bacterium]
MREYVKPALEMEEFDLEDIITLSGPTTVIVNNGGNGQQGGDNENLDGAAAPVDLINLN